MLIKLVVVVVDAPTVYIYIHVNKLVDVYRLDCTDNKFIDRPSGLQEWNWTVPLGASNKSPEIVGDQCTKHTGIEK